MSNEKVKDQPRLENIYRLDGRVPIQHAIPFGLQHVLAMFVANLAPIMLVAGSAVFADGSQGVDPVALARLLQACMFIAGIGTMIQLYPIWRIGAKLPVVMGVSFSFVTTLTLIATTWNYQTMVGAIIVGGCIEGLLGLTYRYWKKIIDPIVSACVVTAIGLSLLNVGARSFGGGMYDEHFGELKYLIVGLITLITCVSFNILAKGFLKQLNVLAGLIVGYIVAIPMGLVDFSSFGSTIRELGFFSFPRLLPYKPEFHIAAIIPLVLVFLVSAAETIGDTSGVVAGGLNRDITEREISGSLAVDGFISAVSGCFGCTPITSFSQNVGLIAMTKVVNRFCIMFGALTLILAGLFPPIGAFFSTLPHAVLGGCTIMMFGSIVASGMRMVANCGFSQRNVAIVALSLSIGIGFTQVPIFAYMPKIISDIFQNNSIAGVFVVSMLLNLILPQNMEVEKLSQDGK